MPMSGERLFVHSPFTASLNTADRRRDYPAISLAMSKLLRRSLADQPDCEQNSIGE
jgi:hypothetical protein